jgi:uncharacterized phage protein (TIGR01671 family)
MNDFSFRVKGNSGDKLWFYYEVPSIFLPGCGIAHHLMDWSTHGRFTGLKDRNGIKIYEGDILRERDEVAHPFVESKDYTVDRLHEVRYLIGNKNDGFRCVSQPTPYYTGDKYYVTWIDPRTMEVVGNIYQNSELLKAGTL